MKPKVKTRNIDERRNRVGPVATNASADKNRRSIIYGVLPVIESLRSGTGRIERIFISEGVRLKRHGEIAALAREQRIRAEKISRREFSRFVDEDINHQGIIALASGASYYDSDKLITEVTEKDDALLLILDGVEDPRNLGAILRTAEGAGADGVFIPERRAVGLTETVAKASAGAAQYVKVAKVANVNRLIDELKGNSVWVVGTSGDAEMDYQEWDWRQPTALVLGSEGKGLH
jgi:23S rRNA (guanosine2251-2'-O)-methyltransferase